MPVFTPLIRNSILDLIFCEYFYKINFGEETGVIVLSPSKIIDYFAWKRNTTLCMFVNATSFSKNCRWVVFHFWIEVNRQLKCETTYHHCGISKFYFIFSKRNNVAIQLEISTKYSGIRAEESGKLSRNEVDQIDLQRKDKEWPEVCNIANEETWLRTSAIDMAGSLQHRWPR